VTSISAAADGNLSMLAAGDILTITLHTSQAVSVTGTPALQLNDNDVASYVGGSGSSALSFAYTVQSSDNVADLQRGVLILPGGATIDDAAGNSLAGPVAGDLGFHVGTTATAPVAVGDAYVMLQGQSATVTVLDSVLLNDTGAPLSASLVTAPADGTL